MNLIKAIRKHGRIVINIHVHPDLFCIDGHLTGHKYRQVVSILWSVGASYPEYEGMKSLYEMTGLNGSELKI